MRLWKKLVSLLVIVLFLLTAGFVIWGETPAAAMPDALEYLESDQNVRVQTGDWLIFQSVDGEVTTGFIFYPGGRVDHRAYAPMAYELASQGYMVIIPRMPLNLAVFGVDKASEVINAYPLIEHWMIGGQSLGGAMAAHYLYQHPQAFKGLVLLASYPASSDDLTDYSGRVLSISASQDGLTTPEKVEASRSLLPATAEFVEIQGGNHAYFGWYGEQSGDIQATITREEQQAEVFTAIHSLLQQINAEE